MKLIKQNDSAGGLIFKQNTNGKAMKQNYNFGVGFNKGASTNCYIECPFVPQIRNPFSIISFNSILPTTDNNTLQSNCFLLRDADNGAKLTYSLRVYSRVTALGTSPVWNTGAGYSNIFNEGGAGDLPMLAVLSDGINYQTVLNNSIGINRATSALNQSESTNLYVALSNFTGIKYESRLVKDFKVYSRKISNNEISYLYNNGLGNDPLSVFGLEAWYTMKAAEILPFKGVDSVCVRDKNGTNHGKIIGLPEGTLQEQLDYANNNLFFPSL